MFHKTLQNTSKQLEKIYYDYVLRPQINVVHTKMRNNTVDVAALFVLMYITGTHPKGVFEVYPDLEDLGVDM